MYDWTIDGMLRAGFSKKMADYLHGLWKQEKESGLWAEEDLEWAHARGFLAESAVAYNLKEAEHIEDYLSDYEYYRIWPLNSWERIWINDKLTLKYMLAGTKYDRYMPKYFYYKTEDRLMPLMDVRKTADILRQMRWHYWWNGKRRLHVNPAMELCQSAFLNYHTKMKHFISTGKCVGKRS